MAQSFCICGTCGFYHLCLLSLFVANMVSKDTDLLKLVDKSKVAIDDWTQFVARTSMK